MQSQADPRFSGLERLYGPAALPRLAASKVCVVGIGGVGSWVIEALARSQVGALTLIDLDEICASNTNRQLHTLQSTIGRPKVTVMAERARAIYPECAVTTEHAFFTAKTADRLQLERYDCVVDAIDNPKHKALMIARCLAAQVPIITVGGAGGRSDPTQIRRGDLTQSTHDGLLRQVRRILRQDHGLAERGPWGVPAIWSQERTRPPEIQRCAETGEATSRSLRIDCATGYGTAGFVTGAFGLAAAASAVEALLAAQTQPGGSRIAEDV